MTEPIRDADAWNALCEREFRLRKELSALQENRARPESPDAVDETATIRLRPVSLSSLLGKAKLKRRPVDDPEREFREKLREWWRSLADLLTFHARDVAEFGAARWSLSTDVLSTLAGFAGYLAVGQIPEPISDAASEGRRHPGPTERRDIGFAVAYCRAAKGGINHGRDCITINDRSPVKTVRAAFGVAQSTVQGWQREIPTAFLGVNQIDGEILRDLMEQAGERYRRARGTRRIEGRAQLA
jgi:hypothetical protein